MFCKYCGEKIPWESPFCTKCGRRQPGALPNYPAQREVPLSPLPALPNNSRALLSYYISMYSFVIPFILSIPAVICGILGLLYAKEHPNARGRNHAWAGIIIGLLSPIFWYWFIMNILK